MSTPLPVAGPWQFALAILGRWQNTVAITIIILLLGWPTVVVIGWMQDMGFVRSMGLAEQDDRQAEHRQQDQVHQVMADALQEQAKISKQILIELKGHNVGASQDRQMLGYFTWKQCVQDNGKGAQICKQFQQVVASNGHH